MITEALTLQPSTLPWYGLFTGDLERRSFQFFLEKTAPQLAGDFECPFWDYMILQSVHQEPALRHITVALGSLHQSFERDGALIQSSRLAADGSFSLHQYLSAMHCLMPTPESSQPLDVCLISCILFACFEAMRGYYASAITHITSGLKILAEIRRNAPDTFAPSDLNRRAYVPIEVLCSLFTRLQAQATVTELKMETIKTSIWPNISIDLDQPVVFKSLTEAREMLEIYTYYYRQHSSELAIRGIQHSGIATSPITVVTNDAVALRDTALALLARWSTALDQFLENRGDSLSERERRGAATLKLRKLDSFLALDAHPSEGEVMTCEQRVWDKYGPTFEHMVALGESISASYSSSSPSASPSSSSLPPKSMESTQTFSLDLGLLSCMFNVATHCRDPFIRRRAIHVLRNSTFQEGVWNSAVMAGIAEKWVEIEEEGLGTIRSCADVPIAARQMEILPVFDIDDPSALVYFSHSPLFDLGTVRREVIKW